VRFGTQGRIVRVVTMIEFAAWMALLTDEWIPPRRPLSEERAMKSFRLPTSSGVVFANGSGVPRP